MHAGQRSRQRGANVRTADAEASSGREAARKSLAQVLTLERQRTVPKAAGAGEEGDTRTGTFSEVRTDKEASQGYLEYPSTPLAQLQRTVAP